jgi:hypothetical protein
MRGTNYSRREDKGRMCDNINSNLMNWEFREYPDIQARDAVGIKCFDSLSSIPRYLKKAKVKIGKSNEISAPIESN